MLLFVVLYSIVSEFLSRSIFTVLSESISLILSVTNFFGVEGSIFKGISAVSPSLVNVVKFKYSILSVK